MARIEKMPSELAGYVALRENHEMVNVGKILVWTLQSDPFFCKSLRYDSQLC